MVLSVHSVVGGALAHICRLSPAASLCAGVVSHFLLDSLPHKDYPIHSKKKNYDDRLSEAIPVHDPRFTNDLIRIGIDCGVGFLMVMTLSFFLSGTYLLWSVWWGAVGGVLPDFLQFIYFQYKKEPLATVQHFHVLIVHNAYDLANGYLATLFQAFIALAFIAGMMIG